MLRPGATGLGIPPLVGAERHAARRAREARRTGASFRRVLAPRGRLLVAFVNPPLELLSRWAGRVSVSLGEPLHWPTPAALRRQVEAAGFEVVSQRRIFRLPAPLWLPPVLTEAVRPD